MLTTSIGSGSERNDQGARGRSWEWISRLSGRSDSLSRIICGVLGAILGSMQDAPRDALLEICTNNLHMRYTMPM